MKAKLENTTGTAESSWEMWENKMAMTGNMKERWASRREKRANKMEMSDCNLETLENTKVMLANMTEK